MKLVSSSAASAVNAAVQKKMHGSGRPGMLVLHLLNLAKKIKALTILNEEMDDLMKIV